MTGVAAYGILAGLALAVFGWLLFESRGNDLVRRAALASLVTAAWAAVLALSTLRGNALGWGQLFVEGPRYASLFLVLSALTPRALPGWFRFSGFALAGGVAGYALLGWLVSQHVNVAPSGVVFSMSGLLLAFIGLAFTEQVIRSGTEEDGRVRALCAAGVGGQFAFDLFLYSQALLLGALDASAWLLRSVVVAVLLVVFACGVRRMPPAPTRVFISRHVVFYTSAFVAVGVYLCLMAIGGYYVREKGGNWGNALQVLFLCGACAVLAWLLFVESPLRRLRVFIATHFYRNKYDYRIEWLRFVHTLSSASEPDIRSAAVRAVAEILGSPGGLLVLRDDQTGKYHLQASWPDSHIAPPEHAALGANDPLPVFLRQRQWVIDLREFQEHRERYGDLQLPHWLPPAGVWRVIAPLLLENHLLGFLVLRAPREPFTMNFEDRDLLKTVGRNVAVQLAQRQADERLAQGRQFDAYNRFAAFVMHDLKNSVAQLQLLVANAERYRDNPEFIDDAIGTIRNTAERMTRLIGQLQSRDVHGSARVVDLGAIAQAAVARSQARLPAVSLQAAGEALPVRADPDRLGAVIDHVIRNAQEATPAEGKVTLNINACDSGAKLEVIDEGSGMDEEFVRNRLFRPFDSTKGSKGMGIGAYQTREYIRALGGDVNVQSAPGGGTIFSIRLELCETKSPSY